MDKKTNEKLLIIDGNAIIHRAYHALPPLTNKKGRPTGAAYGFLLAFFKSLNDFKPEYLVSCFDFPAPNFRMEISKDYKANRQKADPELYEQIPLVKKILEALGVKIFEEKGFEADDLIGAVAKKCMGKNSLDKIILSGDHDVLQLVDKNTFACLLKQGIKDSALFDEESVKEKYGIAPSQLVDYKALRGDPSDNISGVKGIGPKTAAMLLQKFQNLENLYEAIEKNTESAGDVSKKTKEMLLSQKEQCFKSRILSKIEADTPISFSLEECRRQEEREDEAEALEKFEFFNLAKRLREEKAEEKERKSFKKNLELW